LIPLVLFEDDGNSDRDIVEQCIYIYKHIVKTLEARVKWHLALFLSIILLLVAVRQVIQKDERQNKNNKTQNKSHFRFLIIKKQQKILIDLFRLNE
jgi:hypothetical protein